MWIDAGNDADYAKLAAHGIAAPYFDPRDPRVTASYLDGVVQHGYAPGLYFAWNWYPTLSGPQLAEKVDAELRRLAWRGNAPVQLDIESHDVRGYILPCLKRWRELRPKRATSWTLEGMQGGLFSPADVVHIAATAVTVVPQAYTGSMESRDAVAVALDLVEHSFPPALVSMFYDAAHLPPEWSGFAFTQGRLP